MSFPDVTPEYKLHNSPTPSYQQLAKFITEVGEASEPSHKCLNSSEHTTVSEHHGTPRESLQFFCLSEFFGVIINRKWILKGKNQTGFILFFKNISILKGEGEAVGSKVGSGCQSCPLFTVP